MEKRSNRKRPESETRRASDTRRTESSRSGQARSGQSRQSTTGSAHNDAYRNRSSDARRETGGSDSRARQDARRASEGRRSSTVRSSASSTEPRRAGTRYASETGRTGSRYSNEPRRSGSGGSNAPRRGGSRYSSDPRRSGSGRSNPPRRGSQAPKNGGRPPAKPKKRRRKIHISLPTLALCACLLAVMIYGIRMVSIVGIGTPTFVKNVYIGDVSLAGMTKEEGAAVLAEIEEEWLNEVFTLTYQDESWEFTRAMVDADIDYDTYLEYAWNFGHVGSIFQRQKDILSYAKDPVYLTVEVTYDEDKLDAFIDEICETIDVDAVDAVIAADVSEPVVVSESSTGLEVNREQLLDQMVTLICTDEADTAIPVETLFPSVTSDDVSFEVIATFSTDVSSRNSASRSNVRLALNAFNGLTVLPGETISFNDVVGPRTTANGFKEATEYAGDVTTTGIGGGVCQASTTLYNALITAGMTIDKRSPHSMTVSYVDPSLDAAVTSSSKDLVFTNNTDYAIYIYTSVTKKTATVTIYGHKPDYYYVLESVIIKESVASTREVEVEDTEGTLAYYTDERVLYSKGKSGCVSEGWIVAYDWDTGEEVSRTCVSEDTYSAGASIYYVGIHEREETSLADVLEGTDTEEE